MSPPLRLCRSLRWKGFYGRIFTDVDALQQALAENDSAFSCLQTCQPWGEDDDRVLPERCQPGRGCFEPSPHEPRRTLT